MMSGFKGTANFLRVYEKASVFINISIHLMVGGLINE